jgi:hypothetical protein
MAGNTETYDTLLKLVKTRMSVRKLPSGYADCIGPKEISPRRRGGRGVKSS